MMFLAKISTWQDLFTQVPLLLLGL